MTDLQTIRIMDAAENGDESSSSSVIEIIEDENTLLQYGVCRVRIPFTQEEIDHWSHTLSQVTPLNMSLEDGEYAFYRNIVEEPNFPFDRLLAKGEIANMLHRYFLLLPNNSTTTTTTTTNNNDTSSTADDILRMDDAFCIHYNTSQNDTRCAKHTDPSDITLNMCLQCTENMEGSQVLFYGTCQLHGITTSEQVPRVFAVRQKPGYATLHWGHHPHQTLPLRKGKRTNIVVTYCYKEKTKSTFRSRTCYAPDCT